MVAILKQLGFDSYSDYLASPLWKQIRKKFFRPKRRRLCRICKEPATEIHHLAYYRGVLLGRFLGHMVPLCRECHQVGEITNIPQPGGSGPRYAERHNGPKARKFTRESAGTKDAAEPAAATDAKGVVTPDSPLRPCTNPGSATGVTGYKWRNGSDEFESDRFL